MYNMSTKPRLYFAHVRFQLSVNFYFILHLYLKYESMRSKENKVGTLTYNMHT